METRLLKRLNAKECPEHLGERIGAFAEGSITGEEERLEVIRHLLNCPACRYLLEDFFLIENEEAGEEDEIVPAGAEILLSMKTGILEAVSAERMNMPLVPVMSAAGSGSVEYAIPMGGRDLIVRVIGSGDHLSFEIDRAKTGSTYHLLGTSGHQSVRASGAMIAFERVKPGNYLIAEDMRGYISITMEI